MAKDTLTEAHIHRYDGICIGIILGVEREVVRVMLQSFPDAPVLSARSTTVLTSEDIGSEVALSFVNADPSAPLIMGKLMSTKSPSTEKSKFNDVDIDGNPQPLEITGEREITLRCGKASITLTREGKIILRGTYISSRSSGANRIKGGSVHLN